MPMPLEFDDKTFRYRDTETGKFVPHTQVKSQSEEIATRLQNRLLKRTKQLENGVISLEDWKDFMKNAMKEAHIVSGTLGAGGKNYLNKNPEYKSRTFGVIGNELKNQYKALDKFAEQIKNGTQTPAQIEARVKHYGLGANQSFSKTHQAIRISRAEKRGKRLLARRWVNSGNPCADCVGHSTNGAWLNASVVVPPGNACVCRGRCQCGIAYREVKG